MSQYVLALDQGTTSSRTILFGRDGRAVATAQQRVPADLPRPGPRRARPGGDLVLAARHRQRKRWPRPGPRPRTSPPSGITNQRETTILWDRQTGQPVANAIVWQSRVSAPICETLKADGQGGAVPHAHGPRRRRLFSGTKIKHLLDTIPGLRARAEEGEILFGTVDTFLMWRLTGGRVHVTDPSNASRTLLYNIHSLQWDDELLEVLGVPRALLPEVQSSSEVYGQTRSRRCSGRRSRSPATRAISRRPRFGQACFDARLRPRTRTAPAASCSSTRAASRWRRRTACSRRSGWKVGGKVTYCLEGSVFIAGAVVQWLRDGLKRDRDLAGRRGARRAPCRTAGGVYLVPAFVGLGAPYWDPYARGTIIGLTRNTTVEPRGAGGAGLDGLPDPRRARRHAARRRG